jgi:arginyl-tRNA synthetase
MIVSGLRRGVLEHDETGSVIYRTGRSEYATMVVMRDDGTLTEFGRCIGLYDRMFARLDPATVFIEILGIEWKSAGAALGEMVGRLMGRSSDPVQWAFHGSVTVDGHKVSSRTGEVPWVDDLLDAVAAGPAVAHLHRIAEDRVERHELADLIVRGTFLCSPTSQPLPFSLERLVEGRANPGYTIAQAWSRAHCPQAQHGRVPMARTALVQSQLYRRVMLRAVAERDTAKLATYLLGLAEACLVAPAAGPAVRLTLQRVLASLGFLGATKLVRDNPIS